MNFEEITLLALISKSQFGLPTVIELENVDMV